MTQVFGGWRPDRIVIIEFPCSADLVECFSCGEYREILPIREKSSTGSLIMVEGQRSGTLPSGEGASFSSGEGNRWPDPEKPGENRD